MIHLELSIEDAKLLHEQLGYRLVDLDRDLVRTDRHTLQHDLAGEVARLTAIEQRLGELLKA